MHVSPWSPGSNTAVCCNKPWQGVVFRMMILVAASGAQGCIAYWQCQSNQIHQALFSARSALTALDSSKVISAADGVSIDKCMPNWFGGACNSSDVSGTAEAVCMAYLLRQACLPLWPGMHLRTVRCCLVQQEPPLQRTAGCGSLQYLTSWAQATVACCVIDTKFKLLHAVCYLCSRHCAYLCVRQTV